MAKESKTEPVKEEPPKKCGIVMPLAAFGDYDLTHWIKVQKIITQAAKNADFDAKMVSHSDDTGLIHSSIINNLYYNEIVVADVSGRNPNVMFELGIRLAFDKPTVIIKDKDTPFSFDTGVIDHMIYPAGLDFFDITDFQAALTQKIIATYEQSKKTGQKSFLKHFGNFKPSELETKQVPGFEILLAKLNSIQSQITPTKSSRWVQSPMEIWDDWMYNYNTRLFALWEAYMYDINKAVTKRVSSFDFGNFASWVMNTHPNEFNHVNFHTLTKDMLENAISQNLIEP